VSTQVLVDYLIRVTGQSTSAQSAMGSLAKEATVATAAVGGVVAGFAGASVAAVAMANDVTGAVDRINTLATNSGLAAREIAGLEALAASTGKELNNLIPKDLPKRISDAARGTGPVAEAFAQLGVSATNADGSLRSASDVLPALIDGLASVDDATTKAALAQEVFGARSQELTSALKDSGDLRAWIGYAERYGTDVGPEAQRVTAEWQRSMAVFHQSVATLKNAMLPLIDVMANTVLGISAMLVMAKGAASGALEGPGGLIGAIKGAKDELDNFIDANKRLNESLQTTETRFKDVKLSFDGWEATVSASTAKEFAFYNSLAHPDWRNPPAGGGKPPKPPKPPTGGGKASPGWDAGIDVNALEAEQAAFGAQLAADAAAAREQRAAIAEALLAGQDDLIAATEANKPPPQPPGAALGADLSGVASVIADPVGAALGAALGPALAGPIGMLASAVLQLPDVLQNLTETIETLPEALISIPDLTVNLLTAIGDLPLALVEATPEIALGLANAVFKIFTYGFEAFAMMFAEVVDVIPGRIADALADILRNLFAELNPFDGDGNFLFGAAEKARDALPFFDTGGDVTRTGLAVVHEGERVITAEERAALLTGGGGRGAPAITINTPDPHKAARAVAQAIGSYGPRVRLGV